MNDAISRSAVMEQIGKLPLSWEYGQAVTDCWEIVRQSPTIDVAPVVRCKHCESARYDDDMLNDGVVYCCEWRTYTSCDGYCSEGEEAEVEE